MNFAYSSLILFNIQLKVVFIEIIHCLMEIRNKNISLYNGYKITKTNDNVHLKQKNTKCLILEALSSNEWYERKLLNQPLNLQRDLGAVASRKHELSVKLSLRTVSWDRMFL